MAWNMVPSKWGMKVSIDKERTVRVNGSLRQAGTTNPNPYRQHNESFVAHPLANESVKSRHLTDKALCSQAACFSLVFARYRCHHTLRRCYQHWSHDD